MELRLISKPGKFEWTVGYYNYKFNEEPNSISQTQYAVDQYWLDYVTEIAAGVDPAVYDAQMLIVLHFVDQVRVKHGAHILATLIYIMLHILPIMSKKKPHFMVNSTLMLMIN